jgi:hypothetical protein
MGVLIAEDDLVAGEQGGRQKHIDKAVSDVIFFKVL